MRNRIWSIFALLFTISAQAFAVLNEQNLDMTVSVLKAELEKTYTEETQMMERYDSINVKQKVESIDGVETCNVEIVFEPEWNQDMMTEEAKLELGFL